MSDSPRALLTERERDVVRGAEDVDEKTESVLLSRIRTKLGDPFRDDVKMIQKHRPELAERLYDVVCEGEVEDELQRINDENNTLRDRVDDLEDRVEVLESQREGEENRGNRDVSQ